LLAVDVLLRLQAPGQLAGVLVVGGGDDDRVEAGHGQHVVEAFEDLRLLAGGLLDLQGGQLAVARPDVADGDEVGGVGPGGGGGGRWQKAGGGARRGRRRPRPGGWWRRRRGRPAPACRRRRRPGRCGGTASRSWRVLGGGITPDDAAPARRTQGGCPVAASFQ